MPTTETLKNGVPGGSTAESPMSFLRWYLIVRPAEIVSLYMQYAHAFGEAFALQFMAKTLFAPWKSIADEYPSKGLNIQAIVETFFLNVTSRAIGLVIRLVTIISGIAIQLALLIGFVAYLLLWIGYPVVLLVGIPYLVLTF